MDSGYGYGCGGGGGNGADVDQYDAMDLRWDKVKMFAQLSTKYSDYPFALNLCRFVRTIRLSSTKRRHSHAVSTELIRPLTETPANVKEKQSI